MFYKSFCKKAAALLTAIVLLCGLAGCGKKETGSSAPDSVSGVIQSSGASSDNGVSSVPQITVESSVVSTESAGSSDIQSPVKVKPEIEMDGQLISLPCKVKDIKGITIDREYSFAVIPASEDVDERSGAFFYYNHIRIGMIELDGDCSEKPDLDEETVIRISISDDISFSYSGLTSDSTTEDIIAVLGEPSVNSDYYLWYSLDGTDLNHVDFRLNSKGKIDEVSIYLYVR